MQTKLSQDLRYIDITFDALRRAKRIVNRIDGWEGPAFPDEQPTPRSQRIGRIMGRIRAKQCAREGVECRHPVAEIASASESTVPPIGAAA